MAGNGSTVAFSPPSHLTSDVIEICLLSFVIIFGLPVNLYVLSKLLLAHRALKTRLHKQNIRKGVLLLKLNLTVANLLLIVIYVPCKVGWLIIYQWILSAWACRLTHFLWAAAFSLISNTVACLALDRALSVQRICNLSLEDVAKVNQESMKRAKKMILWAWILAFVFGIPQIFVWGINETTISANRAVWRQCSSIFQTYAYCQGYSTVFNITQCTPTFMQWVEGYFLSRTMYSLLHISLSFWLPFLLIVICYCVIIYQLHHYEQTSNQKFAVGNVNLPSQALSSFTNGQISGYNKSAQDECNDCTKSSGNKLSRVNSTSAYSSKVSFDENNKKPNCNSELIFPCQSATSSLRTLSQRSYTAHRDKSPSSQSLRDKLSFRKQRRVLAVPSWKAQMRNRAFRSSAFVVISYVVCWLPYSLLSVLSEFDQTLAVHIATTMNWLKVLVLSHVIVTPFLYGFQKS